VTATTTPRGATKATVTPLVYHYNWPQQASSCRGSSFLQAPPQCPRGVFFKVPSNRVPQDNGRSLLRSQQACSHRHAVPVLARVRPQTGSLAAISVVPRARPRMPSVRASRSGDPGLHEPVCGDGDGDGVSSPLHAALSAQGSNASGFAVVASLAPPASSTLAVLSVGAGAAYTHPLHQPDIVLHARRPRTSFGASCARPPRAAHDLRVGQHARPSPPPGPPLARCPFLATCHARQSAGPPPLPPVPPLARCPRHTRQRAGPSPPPPPSPPHTRCPWHV
jgi:hypothetical protein